MSLGDIWETIDCFVGGLVAMLFTIWVWRRDLMRRNGW